MVAGMVMLTSLDHLLETQDGVPTREIAMKSEIEESAIVVKEATGHTIVVIGTVNGGTRRATVNVGIEVIETRRTIVVTERSHTTGLTETGVATEIAATGTAATGIVATETRHMIVVTKHTIATVEKEAIENDMAGGIAEGIRSAQGTASMHDQKEVVDGAEGIWM